MVVLYHPREEQEGVLPSLLAQRKLRSRQYYTVFLYLLIILAILINFDFMYLVGLDTCDFNRNTVNRLPVIAFPFTLFMFHSLVK